MSCITLGLARRDVDGRDSYVLDIEGREALIRWLNRSLANVCVWTDTAEAFDALARRIRKTPLPVHVITASGRNDFHGVPTRTRMATGPWRVDELDPLTGHLPPL